MLLELEAFVLLSKTFVSIACPVLNLISASIIVCAKLIVCYQSTLFMKTNRIHAVDVIT